VGASPSDETVELVEWNVKPGDIVAPGTTLGVFEASKATMDLECPVAGAVEEILVPAGQTAKVGEPILTIRLQNARRTKKPVSREDVGTPTFSRHRREPSRERGQHVLHERRRNLFAGIGAIAYATGAISVDNYEVVSHLAEHTADEIERLTGIRTRPRLANGETALTLAVAAARDALAATELAVNDLDLVICATGTPPSACPSLACLIVKELSSGAGDVLVPAYDLSAACSGYLYGLQNAYDFLFGVPKGRVLLITAEALSEKLDRTDHSTAPLFGDAATATVLLGGEHRAQWKAMLYRPVISAKADESGSLFVPLAPNQAPYIEMKGHRVFQEAVRSMTMILRKACHDAALPVESLDCIVPHQANQRIIDAIRNRLELPRDKVYSNISRFGNTSSSSIPICLTDVLSTRKKGERIGLAAFGGGYTFGASIIEMATNPSDS
jgi:2-oxoisovalerate dehydrogenase E1 component